MKMEKYLRDNYSADWSSAAPVRVRNFTRRVDLPKLFNHLGFKKGAEIGVDRGRNAKDLLWRMPGLELLLVDPWEDYEVDRTTHRMWHQEDKLEIAKKRLSKYPKAVFIPATSMAAAKTIQEGSLDFVHIDGDHYYEHVSADLREWSKRVKVGGMVTGHDYAISSNSDVIQAVNEFARKDRIKTWFITDEPAPSYFWMKQ